MHKIKVSSLVQYSNCQMYKLINNIYLYPKIFSWCQDAKIISKKENEIIGSLTIKIGSFTNIITTSNVLIENHRINMKLLSGPFKYFQAFWLFEKIDIYSCYITFFSEFIFINKFIDFSINKKFKKNIHDMINAFSQYAKLMYDK